MNVTSALVCILVLAPVQALGQSSPFPDEDYPTSILDQDAKSRDTDASVENGGSVAESIGNETILHEVKSSPAETTDGIGKSGTSVGMGFGFPDATAAVIEHKLFGGLVAVQGFYSLPIEYSLNVRVPADDEALETRLKAGTPETVYPIKVRYMSNFGLNLLVKPLPSLLADAYAYVGVGYRKVRVKTNGRSDLFICLRTAEVPCDKEHESFPSRSEIELTADIEAVSYTARAGFGYQWEVFKRVMVDWSVFGLLKPFPQTTSMSISAELHREDMDGEQTNEILEQMEVYLDKKRESIRNRVINNVQLFDQKILPISTLAVSYVF